jgi:hypothetical protein
MQGAVEVIHRLSKEVGWSVPQLVYFLESWLSL